ncbi:MAG: 5-(carboxyamino)imidazole ribonucleotide synthase [Oscillospiraceae bacterium]|nr:5-(carboxyamino)imidazole ribonucleotide synthase [Oscillospiraceae bacterium]
MSDINRKKIGIVGGGQLGKMMILEAKRLGFYVVTLDPDKDCPSSSISDEQITADFDNPHAYVKLADKVDVITYEFEHIHANILERLAEKGHVVYPSVQSLKVIQNKYSQNRRLAENGIPIPRFSLIDNIETIRRLGAPDKFGYPMMLKSTLGGYDGKGNAVVVSESDIEAAYLSLGGGDNQIMAEEFVDYTAEISIIACRGIDGSRVIYPPAENTHKHSILDTTIVPARVSDKIVKKASEIADRVMEVFEGVGTFCVEMFVTRSGEVLVNEVAPRPHNSGHYTIEGCFANQFENHIRAITGLPFGCVKLRQPTVMVNLLGESDGPAKLLGLLDAYKDPNVHVHVYGKSKSKKLRKMGHITVFANTVEEAIERAVNAQKIVKITGG